MEKTKFHLPKFFVHCGDCCVSFTQHGIVRTSQLINEHSSPPHCVNPLTVAEGKKLRLVIDLQEVNKYLVKLKFRYEDLRSLSEVFEQGFWFFTWDLKSGYHHVDIFHPHQQFLGFAWDFEAVTRYFTFAVLPFGLSTARFCFTKLLRPLVRRWRLMSHSCFLYLDDGIWVSVTMFLLEPLISFNVRI